MSARSGEPAYTAGYVETTVSDARVRPRLASASRSRSVRRLSPRPGLSRKLWIVLATVDLSSWAVGSLLTQADVGLSAVFLAAMLTALAGSGLYRSRLTLSVFEDWPRLVGYPLLAAAVVVSLDLLLRADSGGHAELLRTAVVTSAALVCLRAVGYFAVRRLRALGLVSHRTLVLGAGRVGAHVVELLNEHPQHGLRPVGFLDSRPLLAPEALPAPVLGGNDALALTIAEYRIDHVIVAFGSMKEDQRVAVLRTCDRLDCEISFIPRLFELHALRSDTDHVWGLPLVRHRRAAFRSPSWRVKRLLDVVCSAAALVLLAPLLAVVALAVRWESGRGVLFRQTRVGLDGRPFEVIKFRTLTPQDLEESSTKWSIAHDLRLGQVGRFLRQWSLDELPQLWNIVRGDMSLVGPRPERPHFVDTFASSLPRYLARHRVPSGLTGWAQVHGLRGNTSISERARFDNYYIENWSLALDLRILLMTLSSVITRRGG